MTDEPTYVYGIVLHGGPVDGMVMEFATSREDYPLPTELIFAIEIEGDDGDPLFIDKHMYGDSMKNSGDDIIYEHIGISERLSRSP